MEIGPALPAHLAKKLNSSRDDEDEDEKDEEEKSDSDEEESYGPALPPGFQSISTDAVSKPRIIGPMRPQLDTTRPPPVTSNGLYGNKAIPIKCFVSHRPASREGGSVGRSGKKKRRRMNT